MPKPSAPVFLACVLLAYGACASPQPAAPAARWGLFVRSSPDERETTEIEISSILITNAADARPETTWINEKTERVWLAKKRVVRAGAPATVQWTDSRVCYQLIETLATLVDLDQTAVTPPVTVDDTSNAGASYRIQAAGLSPAGGRKEAVKLVNGAQVRAGAIVKSALDAWRPCWSDTPPTLTARP